MSPWIQFGIGFGFMLVVMTILWFTHGRKGNAGVVDVAWGFGIGLLAIFYACASVEGNSVRRIIVATLAFLWAARLSSHILHRVVTMEEDGRYQEMKENWGAQAGAKMFVFYMMQAFAAALFSLPMLIASHSSTDLGLLDLIGVIIWIVAIGGETIADRQLQHFRERDDTQGKTCREGLWRYSRHPNYFFEWLHWFAYVPLAWGANFGWVTLFAPLLMLFFVLKVTGVPPTERRAIKSRGDDYRRYQKTTSVFFPWPPKPLQE